MIDDLLSTQHLTAIQGLSGSDTVTVYLSDAAALFDRGSYILIGALGVNREYEPRMRGPLRPSSIPLFSAIDGEPTVVLDDVATHAPIADSTFATEHGIKSLARLTVRLLSSTTRAPRWLRTTVFLEVFLSYATRQVRTELEEAVEQVRHYVERNRASLLRTKRFRRLLHPRTTARRHRRLDQVVSDLCERANPYAPGRATRERVRQAFRELASFIFDVLELPRDQTTVSIFQCHHWGGDRRDLTLAFTVPESDRLRINDAVAARAEAGLCRYAATTGSSIIIDSICDAPDSWRDRHIRLSRDGFTMAVPLFAGSRLDSILNVESNLKGVSGHKLAELWRTMPQVERLVSTSFAQKALVDTLDIRNMMHAVSTMSLAPRAAAVEGRLRYLTKSLGVVSVSLLDHENDTMPFMSSGGERGLPESDALSRVRKFLSADPAARLLGVVRCKKSAAVVQVERFELSRGSVTRHECDVASVFGKSRSHSIPNAEAVYTDMFLPLWQPRPGRPKERYVRGLLVLTYDGWHVSPAPLHVENTITIGREFLMAMNSVDKLARKASLYAWATAGVGPVHQLIKVIDECRDDVSRSSSCPEALNDALTKLDVFREQLGIWYYFSRPDGVNAIPGDASDRSLDEVVREAIKRAQVLAGEVKSVPLVLLSESIVGSQFQCPNRSAINATLSCAISNATRWGTGFREVHLEHDSARRKAIVTVLNSASAEEADALADAREIARYVCQEDAGGIFEKLAERAEAEGNLRGLGTWLAARVARELMRGSYSIEFQAGEKNGELEVQTRIEFPCQRFDIGPLEVD